MPGPAVVRAPRPARRSRDVEHLAGGQSWRHAIARRVHELAGSVPERLHQSDDRAVSGGIMGVHSKSQETSIRIYKGQTRYDQWNFVVTAVNRPGGGIGRDQSQGGRAARSFREPVADGAIPRRDPTCLAAAAVAARANFTAAAAAATRLRGGPGGAGSEPELLNGCAVTFNWTKRRSVRPQLRPPCPRPLSKAPIEGFDHRVVNLRPHASDRIVLARRVHAVGQQDDVEVALPVDPERRAGESGVTDRGRGQARAARRRRQHGVPSERARAAWHSDGWMNRRMVSVLARTG